MAEQVVHAVMCRLLRGDWARRPGQTWMLDVLRVLRVLGELRELGELRAISMLGELGMFRVLGELDQLAVAVTRWIFVAHSPHSGGLTVPRCSFSIYSVGIGAIRPAT